jgi:beta-lactamase class A
MIPVGGPDPASAATSAATPTPTPTPDTGLQSEPTATPEPAPEPDATAPALEPAATPSPVPTAPAEADAQTDDPSVPTAAQVPEQSRVAGSDRYLTAVAASHATFPAGADTVLVVSGAASVDAVIASALSANLAAPILYVFATSVPDAVRSELDRLAPARIVVVGGSGVVSDGVLGILRGFAATVTRFGGADRYATSRATLESGAHVATVYLAGGASLLDAPLASVTAASTGRGALLVRGTAPVSDAATIESLRRVGARSIVIVGGAAEVSTGVEASLRSAGFTVSRRTATDSYHLAVAMAGERSSPPVRAVVANPMAIFDVAVGSAIAAATRQPLFYAIEFCTPDAVASHLDSLGVGITGVGGDYWLDQTALDNSPCSVERPRRESELNAAIRATMSAYPGSFTVTVRELGPFREITHVNGGARLEPASMLKIFAAWAALTRIAEGRASINTVLPSGVTLGVCMQVMIHVSDNYCHSDIVHWIGIPTINSMIASAGFTNTFYGSVSPGTSVLYAGNRSSAADMAWMLERLANASILPKTQADHLLALMRSQIWRSRIASGIPPGVGQASKPGSLWIASGLLQADSAIIYGPKYTYAISIIGDDGPPRAALTAISRTVYEHFHGSFGAAASYPVQQMATKITTPLRASPGGTVLQTIGSGVALEVLDAQRIWYQVRYNGQVRWLHYSAMRNR